VAGRATGDAPDRPPGPLRTALRLALAQIRHRPLRALTVAAAVLVATTCVSSVIILDRNTILTRQWIAAKTWGDPDLVATFPLTTLGDARAEFETIRTEHGVDAALTILRVRRPAEQAPVYVVAGDTDAFKFLESEGVGLEEGRCVLGPMARAEDVPGTIGDARIMVGARAARKYFAGRRAADGLFVPDATPGLPEDLPVRPIVWLRTETPDELRAVFSGRAMVQDAPHRSLWRNTEDSAMRAAVKVAGLLALVLSAFVLAHVTRVGLLERSRELAVLRALGLPRRRIVRLGLVEVALVAVPAAAMGTLLGALTAHGLGRLGISTLGRFKVWFMDFPVGTSLLVFLTGVTIPMLGAWFSLRTVRRIDASSALGPVYQSRPPTLPGRPAADIVAGTIAIGIGVVLASLLARVESPEVEGLLQNAAVLVAAAVSLIVLLPPVVAPAAALIGGALRRLFGAMGHVAARTGAAGGRGFRPAVVGVVGVFVIVLTLKNLVAAMETEIADWGRTALAGRVHLELTQGVDPARLERVRQASPGFIILPIVGEWRRPVRIRAIDLEPLLGSDLLNGGEEETVRALTEGSGVVVSRAFAIQYGLSVGDRPAITTTSGSRPAKIIAVTDRFGSLDADRAFVITGRGFAEEHLGVPPDAKPQGLLAWNRNGGRPAQAEIGLLAANLAPIVGKVTSGSVRLEKRLAKTRRDFRIFDAVWIFLAVLAAVGTVGTIFLRALERRRELALLRVLGTTRRQFRTYFAAQGFAVGLLGGVLALILALPFTAGAVHGLRVVSGMDVRFVYSLPWAAACLALSIVLGGAAGLLAAWYARREDWAAALKYE
jgi:cell division protein FtsX